MKLKTIFTFLFAAVAVIFEAYFGILNLVSFFLQVILMAVLVVSFSMLMSRKSISQFGARIKEVSIIITAIIGSFLSVFLSFIAYENSFPGKLSDITISNGKQTVVFLQMSHIATPEFYKQKTAKIEELAGMGYTLLVEWVRPWTPENEKRFSESLGFQFTPTLYTTIASFIGLEAQDNETLFSHVSSGSLVSVDVSIDDIVTIFGTGGLVTVSGEAPPVNIESELANLQDISIQDRTFAGYVVRAIMNLTLKETASIEDILSIEMTPNLFDAILTKRNENLINYILRNPDKKVAIVYGGLHFEWVFSALQKADPNWKIVNIASYTPYNE